MKALLVVTLSLFHHCFCQDTTRFPQKQPVPGEQPGIGIPVINGPGQSVQPPPDVQGDQVIRIKLPSNRPQGPSGPGEFPMGPGPNDPATYGQKPQDPATYWQKPLPGGNDFPKFGGPDLPAPAPPVFTGPRPSGPGGFGDAPVFTGPRQPAGYGPGQNDAPRLPPGYGGQNDAPRLPPGYGQRFGDAPQNGNPNPSLLPAPAPSGGNAMLLLPVVKPQLVVPSVPIATQYPNSPAHFVPIPGEFLEPAQPWFFHCENICIQVGQHWTGQHMKRRSFGYRFRAYCVCGERLLPVGK